MVFCIIVLSAPRAFSGVGGILGAITSLTSD